MSEALDTARHTPSPSGAPTSACDVTVIVPVLNEEECLPELHTRLTAVMQSLAASYEIIYVDDGSTDGSLRLMRRFSDDDVNVRFVSLTRNFGQAAAFAAGQRASRGWAVVTIDSDLQNPPEEIPKLLNKFREGYEVVYGVRVNRQDPWLRRASSAVVARLLKAAMGTGVEPGLTGFMVTHRRIVDEINRCPEKARFHPTLCGWLTGRVAHVDVKHDPRQHGKSRYSYGRLIRLALDVFTGYTLAPLRMANHIGALSCIVGAASALWAVGQTLTGGVTPGSLAVVAAVCLVGGAQLIAIGVVGGYLGRTYSQSLDRPLFVIRQTSDNLTPMKTATASRREVEQVPAAMNATVTQPT